MGKKIFKLLITSIFAILLGSSFFTGNLLVGSAENVMESKEIDVYLIGGQSNAAGYSNIKNNPVETFENVGYVGITEVEFRTGTGQAISTDKFNYENIRWSVSGGMGSNSGNIGPEYGMAKVLNEVYTGGKKALIYKTAAGGTSLLDKTRELSEKFGNWYPRSLWEDGYTPDITQNVQGNDPTGLLYKFFVENFRKTYNELVSHGYTPIIKAMAWMQGETDIYNDYELYGDTLKTFISDLRTDLYEITGDTQVKGMPFIIGKLAPSFADWNNGYIPAMHAQQERVAAEMSGVATISTDDLIIVNSDGSINGTDKYHFNFSDAVKLGTRFGGKALEISDLKYVSASAIGGKISYKYDEADASKISFTMIPNEHFKLVSFKVNGTEQMQNVVNNTVTVNSTEKRTIAEAIFEEKTKFSIKYADVGEAGGFQYLPNSIHEGEKLSLRLWLNDGYTAEKVTFDGSEMTYNTENNCYEIIVNQSGTVEVSLLKTNVAEPDPFEEPRNGCSGSINTLGISLLSVICFGFIIFSKKKA